jgi:hypothetical protein
VRPSATNSDTRMEKKGFKIDTILCQYTKIPLFHDGKFWKKFPLIREKCHVSRRQNLLGK